MPQRMLQRGTPLACCTALAQTAACLGLLCTLAASAQAQSPSSPAGHAGNSSNIWHAVGNQTLDSLRGGFSLGNGPLVSFGITRAVYVNGTLATETTLNVGSVPDLTPAQAAQLGQKLQTLSLVQNGPGNTFMQVSTGTAKNAGNHATAPTISSLVDTAGGTVIQNTLNNQHILYQTTVNASSNGMGMVRSANLHNTLAEALQQGIGQR